MSLVQLSQSGSQLGTAVDLTSYAPARFRTAVLASGIGGAFIGHSAFNTALFRMGASVLARVPNYENDVTTLATAAGDTSLAIHNFLANQDSAQDDTLFQEIADKLAVWSFYEAGVCLIGGLKTGKQSDGSVGDGTLDPSMFGKTVKMAGWQNGVDVMPAFGAVISPIYQLLNCPISIPVSNGGTTTLGSLVRTLVGARAKARPDLWTSGGLGGTSKALKDAGLAVNAVAIESELSLAANNMSFDTSTALNACKHAFWSSEKIALTGTPNLSDALNNAMDAFNQVMASAEQVEELISDIEALWDMVSSLVPEVIEVITVILALLA